MTKYFLAVASLSPLAGCTDPTVIGGGLLGAEGLPLTFTDTLPVGFATVPLDTASAGDIQFAGNGNAGAAASFGCLDDPAFGTTTSRVGFELVVVEDRDSLVGLLTRSVDSAVLVIPLATAYQVGDTTAATSVRVVGAAPGTVDRDEVLTSDPLDGTGVAFGAATAVPARDSSDVTIYSRRGERDTARFAPTLRIPLDVAAFTEAALAPARAELAAWGGDEGGDDPISDTAFTAAFGGLILEPDPDAPCASTLPAIDLRETRLPELGVTVYANLGEGRVGQYRLAVRRGSTTREGALRPTYAHAYGASPAGRALGHDDGLDGGRAFAQGLDGLMVAVALPDPAAGASGPVAVNYAALEVPVLRDGFAEPLDLLLPQRRNAVGDLEDIPGGGGDGGGFIPLIEGGAIGRVGPYGGSADSVEVYRINLTTYVQGIAAGEFDPEVFLVPSRRSALGFGSPSYVAGRTILAVGPEDGRPGPRLLLATTELP